MRSIATLLSALLLIACAPDAPETQARHEAPPRLGLGVELANMDPTVAPQEDFFLYVNGGWLANTEIPSDRSVWGSFAELVEAAEEQVEAIVLEATAEQAAPGSNAQKIGDLYRSFMDVERIETLGLTPLDDKFAAIDAISSHDDLAAHWSHTLRTRSGTTPVSVFVGQDQRQSDSYVTSMNQSGIGLPEREYYLSEDERSQGLRDRYVVYVTQLMDMAGFDGATAASRILDIETRIARAHWTRERNRDRNATYNKMTLAELDAAAPGIDWSGLVHGVGAEVDEIVVRQPDYLQAVAAFVSEVPVSHWQDYHRFNLLRATAGFLPEAFVEVNFDFYGRTLSGQPENRSREKRGVATVQQVLGFMVGEVYVEQHFPPVAKERMDELVANLKVAFREAIDELEWMSDETKLQAQEKLSKFNTKIGYPDVWRDYDCIEIEAGDLIGNMHQASACEHERMVSRLGSPVDRDEWFMTPQTVNAYYSPTMNEIVFPAAILQPPFFDVEADDAINYGAIGGVIGHEITHGFDDQGRRSDGDGNLRDWWTAEDDANFSARAQRMIDQYNAYNPIDDLHINGAVALGENIADLGGLTVSYRAYMHSLGGREAPVIEGFTGPQRFFLGWGQVWRIKFRDEALRRQLLAGVHSPGMYRVRGVVSNMPEFYEAFGVEEGDGMWRPEAVRVKIW